MRTAVRRAAAAPGALLLLALAAGCGKDAKPGLAPAVDVPPPVQEVFPAARSARVWYDTDIWVRFSEPLDPATVNERTVFLKLDTARHPVDVTYDASSWTVRLVPLTQLALLRTYTVEITPGVATAGGSVTQGYFWQFKTNGLRRLEHPVPEAGATDASPHAMLRWDGTDATAGNVAYDVYVGEDSAAVAARSIRAAGVVTEAAFLPRAKWGTGARRYWAVDAANQTTGERLSGPVWRFETLKAQTPVDSLKVDLSDWAYYIANGRRLMCMAAAIGTFPDNNNGIRWRLHPGLGDLKLAGARLVLYVASSPTGVDPVPPLVMAIGEPWGRCEVDVLRPRADARGPIAGGTLIGLASFVRFEGDAFTAHLEAAVRYGYGYGYRLWANRNVTYRTPAAITAPGTNPVLTLYYYRTSPSPAPGGLPAP